MIDKNDRYLFEKASSIIKNSDYCLGFTGAGISVESGIPPFRGEGGLWSSYDPIILDLDFYLRNSEKSWPAIKKLFYDFFRTARPNDAHKIMGKLYSLGIIKKIITQNIDDLHQKGGCSEVIEFHGTTEQFVCISCQTSIKKDEITLSELPPLCPKCGHLLKPDFVFFGEQIPDRAQSESYNAIMKTDCLLIVGTSGEVMPACSLPYLAKKNGSTIIEINPHESTYTSTITDIFLPYGAQEAFHTLIEIAGIALSSDFS